MLRAAAEQFGSKCEEEIAHGKKLSSGLYYGELFAYPPIDI